MFCENRIGHGLNKLLCFGVSSLTLIATSAEAERLNNFRLLTLGTLTNFTSLITILANRFARLVARLHRLDPSTFRAFLMSGSISIAHPSVAALADWLTRLSFTVNYFGFFTDATNTFHETTSFFGL